MEFSDKQKKRINKLSKFSEDKDFATIENLMEFDEKIDDVKESVVKVETNLIANVKSFDGNA